MIRTLLFLAALPLLMGAAEPMQLTPAEKDSVRRVESYLSGLSTLVADFNQVDANGGLASGKFYLKRPGKMRWQYSPPTPILIVSRGKVLTYYDSELDQVNYVPVDDTLAGFLAQPQITLQSDSTELTRFTSADGVIRATVVQKKKPDEGSLTMEFSDGPLQLRQLVVTDASGQRTQIQLQNAQFGVDLPEKLFTFEDPRGIKARRR